MNILCLGRRQDDIFTAIVFIGCFRNEHGGRPHLAHTIILSKDVCILTNEYIEMYEIRYPSHISRLNVKFKCRLWPLFFILYDDVLENMRGNLWEIFEIPIPID